MSLEQMTNMDAIGINDTQYLGEQDATKEWNDNEEEAYNFFLHTDAYHSFLDSSALILLGQTGTGKTSISRCLESQIKEKNNRLLEKCTSY